MNMRNFAKTCRVLVSGYLLASLFLAFFPLTTFGEEKALIFIEPNILTFDASGQNFTVLIKVSHAVGVNSWQIALEFNQTVANLTAWDLPSGHIFDGRNPIVPDPAIEDSMGGRKYILWGASLLTGKVDVPDVGILCRLNFTTIGEGHAKLRLGTEEDPILTPSSKLDPSSGKYVPSFYCKLETIKIDPKTGQPIREPIPLEVESADVIVGEAKVPPVAYFEVTPVPFSKEGLYLVPSDAKFFVNKPIIFNASKSYDRDGNIVAYEWDFGDGNVTVVDSPIVYHVYKKASRSVTITLTVRDNDDLASEPFTRTISVGMALTLINYTYYLEVAGALIVAIIVLSVIWKIFKYRLVKQKPHL
jgi:hypothetical protein